MKFFPPEAALSAELLKRGHRILHTCTPMNIVQAANEAIRRGVKEEPRTGFFITESHGLELIALWGKRESHVRLRGEDITGDELLVYSKHAPGVAIDLGFIDILLPEERRKVKLQTELSRSTIRRLRRLNKRKAVEEPFEGKVVYLDPSAEEELTDVEADTRYIIGGIVDKGNRLSGITRKMAERRDAERRSIKLFGKLLGVPDTITSITAILAYMFRGIPKDLAILLVAPKRSIKTRLKHEQDEDIRKILEWFLRHKRGRSDFASLPTEALRVYFTHDLE